MIQPTEFRIGNYLLVNNSLQQISALCIDSNISNTHMQVGYIKDGDVHYEKAASDKVQPVPLTDEILEQGGFKFDAYFKLWQKMKEVFGTGTEMELDRDHTALDFSHRPILKDIQYLHELQNLYYALNRKELPMDFISNKNIKENAEQTIK